VKGKSAASVVNSFRQRAPRSASSALHQDCQLIAAVPNTVQAAHRTALTAKIIESVSPLSLRLDHGRIVGSERSRVRWPRFPYRKRRPSIVGESFSAL